MDLPDCPPGAEGYHDSVTEVPKKPEIEESECTKAEQEFQEHLNSLKIKLEDGSVRCMVEKRGRDVSSNWIYLCYPCAAVCSGESILQTHISGKKHKIKLALKTVWPVSIYTEHPYVLKEKGVVKTGATEKINQKMAEEVILHNKKPSELDLKYNKYKDVPCHIQETLDAVKAPLVGVEYLIEHPPEQAHYEPSYLCTLCSKQGHPRTIVNHLTCYWHRCNYLARHFAKAHSLLAPYRCRSKYRDGFQTVVNRLAQRIDDKYGRLKPLNIDKEEFEKDKERIFQWIFKSHHISEDMGLTFEEVVDEDLINSLAQPDSAAESGERNPSPPVVPAPVRPHFNNHPRPAGLQERRHASTESLSDVSDEEREGETAGESGRPAFRGKYEPLRKPTFEQYPEKQASSFRARYPIRNFAEKTEKSVKPHNHEYKMKLAEEKKQAAIEAARKTLAYHEKNPEKHPMYPEEWKKFWNKRYKEIQAGPRNGGNCLANGQVHPGKYHDFMEDRRVPVEVFNFCVSSEGKDPAKHDFKPEWISFWTARMRQLHDEELRVNVTELFRKMGLPPPDLEGFGGEGGRAPDAKRARSRSPHDRNRSPDLRRRSPDPRRRSPDSRRRSPDPRRRSPEPRRRLPEPRRRSPDFHRRSPLAPRRHTPPPYRRPSPPNRKSPPPRRRSPPDYRRAPQDFRRDRRSPGFRPSPPRRRTPERRRSPPRSRSPVHKRSPARSQPPEGAHRSGSPLSQRAAHRNRSPLRRSRSRSRSRSPHTAPSLQTVLISDDELKPDDGLSPWNSDNDIDSVCSKAEKWSRGGSVTSRNSRSRPRGASHPSQAPPAPQDFGPTDSVVATLRLLVALEDYLGSLGPKIVDLLTDALKMEKEKANSSEELLEREGVVALLETAKEKLKGAVQAGLVGGGAAAAVRAAVVRVAAALHEADTRAQRTKKASAESKGEPKGAPVAVAGVGAVERAEIAAQMAAALVAEGRTDVSPEELEQLVDAVVGMAEAKKREVQAKKKAEVKTPIVEAPTPLAKTNTASALQMLQSAYDDLNTTAAKQDAAADAMDGLSDSDLETLLRNFNELSAEEQHSLIAYLKKLEVREPQRVERLRRFVSAAAASAQTQGGEQPSPAADQPPVTVESDDDDYTVEEVFQSATQKVKENQIQQEMEIVKKSLEESKASEDVELVENRIIDQSANIMQNMSSAADLLALVQASIQSTSQSMQPPAHQSADHVVTSNSQPRSFGDVPDPPLESIKPSMSTTIPSASVSGQSSQGYEGLPHPPQSQINFGRNGNNPNETYGQNIRNMREPLLPDVRQPMMDRPPLINDHPQNFMTNNRQYYMQDNRQPPMNNSGQSFLNDNRQQPIMSDNRQPLMSDNRQPLMSDHRQPFMTDHRQPLLGDNRQPLMSDHRQPLLGDNRQPLLSDNRPPLMSDHRQPLLGDHRQSLLGDSRQPLMTDLRPSLLGDNRQLSMSDHRQPLLGDNKQPSMNDNRQPFMNSNRQPLMSDNRQPLMNDNRQPLLNDNRQPLMTDEREPVRSGYDNYNQVDPYNEGTRNNFRNDRMQDNYNSNQEMEQQRYGNYNQNPNPNFRGRGRGNFGGVRGGRSRGRGRK